MRFSECQAGRISHVGLALILHLNVGGG
jgi:hypothetical protein